MTPAKRAQDTDAAEAPVDNEKDPDAATDLIDGAETPDAVAEGPAVATKRPLGVKEVIPLKWKVVGESGGLVLTLFKSVELEDSEAQLERLTKDGFYTNLRLLDVAEKITQPPQPEVAKPREPRARAPKTAAEASPGKKSRAPKEKAEKKSRAAARPPKKAPKKKTSSGRTSERRSPKKKK